MTKLSKSPEFSDCYVGVTRCLSKNIDDKIPGINQSSETKLNNSALLVVDTQNDFFENGSLPVSNASDIIVPINKLLRKDFKIKMFSKDYHPPDHESFSRFPKHCVQQTWGCQLNPQILFNPQEFYTIYKGYMKDVDSSSVFKDDMRNENTIIENQRQEITVGNFLTKYNVRDLYIVGLLLEYCVYETVIDALDKGFNVKIAREGVSGNPYYLKEMEDKDAKLISVEDI